MTIKNTLKNKAAVASAITATLITLSACGGSSGNGTPIGTVPDDANDGTDQQGNPDEQNQGTPSAGSDYFCSSHQTTDNTVIGNNVYQFKADTGQCFGTIADNPAMTKRSIDTVALPTGSSPAGYASISTTAKLSSMPTSLVPGGAEQLYLSFSVTNNHSGVICIGFSGATLANSDDQEINEIEAEVMGDLYYGERSGGFRFSTDCIAAGATRFVWGTRLASTADLEAGGLASIDHLNVSYSVAEPESVDYSGLSPDIIALLPERPQAYFPDALTPQSANWTSSSRTIQGSAYHDYAIASSFLNNTEQSVSIDFRLTDLIYMDNDDYIIYTSLASLDDFLAIEKDELTDANYWLEAMGGTTGFADDYKNVLPAVNGEASFTGRASRLFMALELCHGLDIGRSCDVRN